MGNCCSDEAGGRAAVGGTAATSSGTANDAVDNFFKARGFSSLSSQIEVIKTCSLFLLLVLIAAV